MPQLKGITRERLERDPHVRLNLHGDESAGRGCLSPRDFPPPTARRGSTTPSLIAARHGPGGVVRPAGRIAASSTRISSFPLELLARKADNFLNSTFVNLPSIQKMERQHELEIASAMRTVAASPTATGFASSTSAAKSSCAPASTAPCRGRCRRAIGMGKVVATDGVNINVLTSDAAHRSGWWCYVLLHSGRGRARHPKLLPAAWVRVPVRARDAQRRRFPKQSTRTV